MNSSFDLPENFSITAHAGCMGTRENSVESIRLGFENADIVEFDLWIKDDGTPVLSHDKPKGDCVTLEKAFALLSGCSDKKANVDLKSFDGLEIIQTLSEKYGVTDRIFFTGVYEKNVEKVKKACPKIKFYLNLNVKRLKSNNEKYIVSLIKTVKKSGAVGINCNFKKVSSKIANAFVESGLSVSLWTADTDREIKKALRLSPNNITSKKPNRVSEIIK